MEISTLDEAIDTVENFMDWSLNFEFPRPGALLLDIIGYSQYNYGGPIIASTREYEKIVNKMGYLEIDMLGKALIAYSSYPLEVGEWIFNYENTEH
jgi:hypothetical protein